MMNIILVSGYIGMGKDHFFTMLNRRSEWESTYSMWVSTIDLQLSVLTKPAKLIKFATKLKSDIASILGITLEELELKKDTPLDVPYPWKSNQPINPTYRDTLVDYAYHIRSTNPEYWVKCAAEECELDKLNVIADWRNYNEMDVDKHIPLKLKSEGVRIIKARVHREGVIIPPDEMIIEHLLDETPVDLLILSPGKKPSDYKDIFPWTENMNIQLKLKGF